MLMDRIALALLIVGGVNWGSVGLFRFDIVAWLFGGQTAAWSTRWSAWPRSGASRCCSAATPFWTRNNKRECLGKHSLLLFEIQPRQQRELRRGEQREAEAESPMLRLVAE